MRALRVIRWAAFAGIALLLAAIAAFEFVPGVRELMSPRSGGIVAASAEDTVNVPAGVPIGGPFELIDEKGHPVTDADYRGRWMLVFFGYTNCPDECPLTLQKMATALQELGPPADRIAPLFITVDPVRDTTERLASYLENFDTRIIGLTAAMSRSRPWRSVSGPLRARKERGVRCGPRQPLDLCLPHGTERKAECAVLSGRHPERLMAALRTRLSSPRQAAQSNSGRVQVQ